MSNITFRTQASRPKGADVIHMAYYMTSVRHDCDTDTITCKEILFERLSTVCRDNNLSVASTMNSREVLLAYNEENVLKYKPTHKDHCGIC